MLQSPAISSIHRLLLTTLIAFPILAHAQVEQASVELPNAPVAQQTTPPAGSSAGAPSSTSVPSANAQDQQKQPSSDEVLKKEEKQRAFGVMPMFQSVGRSDNIPPLSPRQKFHLMLKSSTDPFIFAQAAVVAGIGQARDTNSGTKTVIDPATQQPMQVRYGFGQGASGYFKRFGSSYADTVDGNFWGNAVLPILLKEDPRYFRMGTGSFKRRFLYSASTSVWCRRDNGKWGPNYANVGGNFIAGGISNLYYPAEDRGFEKTVIGAMTVTAQGIIGAELIEFLPDIEHHFLKKRQPQP